MTNTPKLSIGLRRSCIVLVTVATVVVVDKNASANILHMVELEKKSKIHTKLKQ